ncbi:MAG: DUF302 domain-containing protein [Chromatiales bacterium]|jgi:uncharacterized protein (DUF302 family)
MINKLYASLVLVACLTLPGLGAAGTPGNAQTFDISQTVVKMPLADDVSPDDAIDSMKLRANLVNMMFVAHQPLSQQLEKMGKESGRLEIFQFCDPLIAAEMVKYNSIFAAYMPCRIALVEEPDGRFYLMMLDLDMLIQGTELTPELKALAEEVNTKLTEIITAGAEGAL